jgi:stress-induced morphogen
VPVGPNVGAVRPRFDIGRAGSYFAQVIEPAALRSILEGAFPGSQVEIVDLTGTQDHYQVKIRAEAFRGESRMRQHKLVYAALGALMRGPIHALSLQTSAPG